MPLVKWGFSDTYNSNIPHYQWTKKHGNAWHDRLMTYIPPAECESYLSRPIFPAAEPIEALLTVPGKARKHMSARPPALYDMAGIFGSTAL